MKTMLRRLGANLFTPLKIFLMIGLLSPGGLVYAEASQPAFEFTSSQDIKYLNQTMVAVRQRANMPVLFPKKIAVKKTSPQLYASYASDVSMPNYHQYWQINVGVGAECRGVKYCNMGFISAERGKQIVLTYESLPDRKPQRKQQVKLKNNMMGYYTPYHVQASGVEPTMEWQSGDILYKLRWAIPTPTNIQQQILLEMVNSIQ